MSGDSPELNMAAITDAKSLFDNLSREQFTGAERRAALEICVIRDSLESLGGSARWVPHEENPVDCLTKLRGNAARMTDLMRTGRFQLTDVEAEMHKRREYREQTGKRNPRPMRTTKNSVVLLNFGSRKAECSQYSLQHSLFVIETRPQAASRLAGVGTQGAEGRPQATSCLAGVALLERLRLLPVRSQAATRLAGIVSQRSSVDQQTSSVALQNFVGKNCYGPRQLCAWPGATQEET